MIKSCSSVLQCLIKSLPREHAADEQVRLAMIITTSLEHGWYIKCWGIYTSSLFNLSKTVIHFIAF